MPDEKEKTAVRINYSSPGAQPPIYIAGSFTNPPWQPMVLQYAVDESLAHTKDEHIKAKEYRFYTDLQVAEGRWEYKFRLGIGDWWACDTRLETGGLKL